jgi:hypothetical protein
LNSDILKTRPCCPGKAQESLYSRNHLDRI